jgi:hypothetical protein
LRARIAGDELDETGDHAVRLEKPPPRRPTTMVERNGGGRPWTGRNPWLSLLTIQDIGEQEADGDLSEDGYRDDDEIVLQGVQK